MITIISPFEGGTHQERMKADHTVTTWQVVVCERIFCQLNQLKHHGLSTQTASLRSKGGENPVYAITCTLLMALAKSTYSFSRASLIPLDCAVVIVAGDWGYYR